MRTNGRRRRLHQDRGVRETTGSDGPTGSIDLFNKRTVPLCSGGRKVGVMDRDVNVFTSEAVLSTLTNVDFDPDRFVERIKRDIQLREQLKKKVLDAGGKVDFPDGPANFRPLCKG